MKKVLSLLSAIAFAATTFSCKSAEHDKNTISLNVCSYNIGNYNHGQHSGYSGDDISDKIIAVNDFLSNFDVVCMQENAKYIDAESKISSELKITNRTFTYNVRGLADKSISSVYPLYNAKTGFFAATYKDSKSPYLSALVRASGVEITVYCCHLAWRPVAVETRKAQMCELVELTKNEPNVIVCADCNTASIAEFKTLTEAGFEPVNDGTRTYNYKQDYTAAADTSQDRCFDNIFIKGDFTGQSKVYDDMYDCLMSDHLPISTNLVYKEENR